MLKLTENYTKKGFYVISSIPFEGRTFIKCGNIKDNYVYFFEVINDIIYDINDSRLLERLISIFNYKSNSDIIF